MLHGFHRVHQRVAIGTFPRWCQIGRGKQSRLSLPEGEDDTTISAGGPFDDVNDTIRLLDVGNGHMCHVAIFIRQADLATLLDALEHAAAN